MNIERKMRKETVYINISDFFDTEMTIEESIEKLKQLDPKTVISDTVYETVCAYTERMETEEEARYRVEREQKQAAYTRALELKQLAELKAKYEQQ